MESQFGGLTTERFESIKTLAAEHALSIKKSYDKSLNIIAVAGAIIAQIAITGLSLTNVDQIHWTAEASFVISLVAGLLSVYSACIMQVILGGMHSPDEVLKWLTTIRIWAIAGNPIHKGRMSPSLDAAMMLVAPIQLLNWSLLSLLVGIGIYYGLIFTQNLGTLRGESPNLATLLVYVTFIVGAVASFALPALSDSLGTTRIAAEIVERKTGKSPGAFGWDQEHYLAMSSRDVYTHRSSQAVQQPGVVGFQDINVDTAANALTDQRRSLDRDTIVNALRASIDAQKVSLDA